MKSKKWTISIVAILLVLTIGASLLGIFGTKIGRYDILGWGDAVELGLDLRGGVYVVYTATDPEQEDFESLFNGTLEVLRRRLDNQGYTEATVSRQGNDGIRVEIPAVEDPDAVMKILGSPAYLEFRDPNGNMLFDGSYVKKAVLDYNTESGYVVAFELNDEGTTIFAAATSQYLNQEIGIYLDDKEISSPTVNSVISGGSGYIEGSFTRESAEELAMLIQSGALPLNLEQTEVRTISATLGEDALSRAVLAGLIGLALVMIFMVIVYRIPGLIADLALTIYIVIVMYALCLIPGIQLTLPGIAGIILGVGMAVDANVIIFERLKEELRAGKTVRNAVKQSFQKAIVAVLDSNITTMIAAVVLIFFGTGTIKGYAYTLAISIVVSMITAVLVTRFLLQSLITFGVQKPSLFGLSKNAKPLSDRKIPVVKIAKFAALLPVVILLIGAATGFTGGFNFGIDFAGGTIYTVDLKADFQPDDVVALVRETVTDTQTDVRVSVSDGTQAVISIQDRNQSGDDYEAMMAEIKSNIREAYAGAEDISVDRVGAVASDLLIKNALTAIGITCVLMLVYISIRFEFFSAIAAVVALIHDMGMMICVVCILNIQINSSFIAAILTILGYSINNTIVVFDRIRDNNRRLGSVMNRFEIVNKSVSETLTRSLYTSLTTLLTVVCIYFLGVTSIKEFTLPIIVGLFFGTYSSVLLSGPFWAWMQMKWRKSQEKRALKKAKS